jgi:L-lactate dehydrogenase complex protein LldE
MPIPKKVSLFIPCFIDQLYPETAMNMVKILEKVGCMVSYNPNQTCCGQIGFNGGHFNEAALVAEKFLADFSDKDSYVVAPSASCIGMIRNQYKKLLPENEALDSLMSRAFEFTEFLVEKLEVTSIPNAQFSGKAVYHDSCSALRELHIKDYPRQLLSSVNGLQLVEIPEAELCCGFGGTFSIKHDGISGGMAAMKIENVMAARAQYIISSDSSCLMHLQGYADHIKYSLKTVHIADVLANGW